MACIAMRGGGGGGYPVFTPTPPRQMGWNRYTRYHASGEPAIGLYQAPGQSVILENSCHSHPSHKGQSY